MSRLLPDERFISFPPSLAARIGVEETLVLCEINYRLGPDINGAGSYIPASAKALSEWLPFLSERTIRRVIRTLSESGLISVEQRGFDRSFWVTVNRDHATLQSVDPSRPCAQTRASMRPDWPDASGQIGRIDAAKLAASLYIEDKNSPEEKEALKRRRATWRRFPEGWSPTPEQVAAITIECPDVDLRLAERKLRDWEFARPKTDPLATWRNWMREEQTRAAPRRFVRRTKYEESVSKLNEWRADAPEPRNSILLGDKS